jgi:transcriptional regulator with XRE-family HTH domain
MFSEAFNETLEKFKISGREIAARSGLREATISQFRHGKQAILSDGLERIIKALPPEARNYMFFRALIGNVSNQDIYLFLNAIALTIKESKDIRVQEQEFILN